MGVLDDRYQPSLTNWHWTRLSASNDWRWTLSLLQSYLGDFQQIGVLVDSNITQILASTQLASDLLQVLCQVCLCILDSSLSIVILPVHSLYSTQTCCTVITQACYDRVPVQDAMIASLASCNSHPFM